MTAFPAGRPGTTLERRTGPAGRIRVLQLAYGTSLYGAERWVLGLIRHLDPARIETVVACILDRDPAPHPLLVEARRLGFPTLALGGPTRRWTGAIRPLREAIPAHGIDVVHSHGTRQDLVRIATPAGKLTVKAENQAWILAEKAGYPVDPAKVRALVLGLANLQLVEAKTANPQRLERLDLQEPTAEGSASRMVELMGGDGASLAAAVVGKASPSLYGGGRGGVYVRRAADNQAWLAAGELDVPSDAMTMIDTELVDMPLDQVARVILRTSDGAAVTLSRPDAGAEFTTDATCRSAAISTRSRSKSSPGPCPG